jgi:hypothetical protein
MYANDKPRPRIVKLVWPRCADREPFPAPADYMPTQPQLWRILLSRKIIITLATALAAATLVVGTADAKKPNNGPNNNGPQKNWNWKHHNSHFAHWNGYYLRPVSTAVRVVEQGPCTCLTKGYTPEGMVVFKDQCTKEMAAAPVDGSSDHAQVELRKN